VEDRNVARLTRPASDASTASVGARRKERFFVDAVEAVLLGAALLVLVVLTAFLIPEQPLRVDRAWSDLMSDVPSAVLKDLALAFNFLGRGLIRGLSIAAIAIVLLVRRRIVALLAYGLAESVAPLLSSVTKALVHRPRPPNAMVHASGSSFPSGHATYAGVTCVALVLLFTTPPRRLRWWALAGIGIAAMAWSRTYLQAHWLSDVVTGSILGIGVALLAFGYAQMLPAITRAKRESRRSASRLLPAAERRGGGDRGADVTVDSRNAGLRVTSARGEVAELGRHEAGVDATRSGGGDVRLERGELRLERRDRVGE
jgi:undecaprenyl-diphosphatase